MNRPPTQKDIDPFFASASQVFCYYSWYVEISPRLLESKTRKGELLHFRITENAVAMGFLINLRRLDEFFHLKKKYPDDVRAYEFGFGSTGGFLTASERTRIEKKIAHPTEVPDNSTETVYLTYVLAHKALKSVFQFINYLLAGPHPPSTRYGKSIEFTKKQYLAFWNAYTDLVPADERLLLHE